MMANSWDERYSIKEYAYGEKPNEFLAEQLALYSPGEILFPADGEGRNSVFAAQKGWNVSAFDISIEGKKKAQNLANKAGVSIQFDVANALNVTYQQDQFDAIAFIYAHFPGPIKSICHKNICSFLKKGGVLIFEAFSKTHLQYNSKDPKIGGPKDLETLFSKEEIELDFSDFEILLLEEKEIQLNEGLFHIGTGSVIRCVARRK